jgi:transcriptional regulator with XRE-family HTH domain
LLELKDYVSGLYDSKLGVGERGFGEYLRGLRQQKGLTQDELAGRIRISQNYLAEVETGKKYPSLRVLSRIARYFEESPDKLLYLQNRDMLREFRGLLRQGQGRGKKSAI